MSMQNGKKKKQKKDEEIKENNAKGSVVSDLNCEEKQVKRKEIDILDCVGREKNQNDIRSNGDIKHQEEKEMKYINHDVKKLNGVKMGSFNCDTEPKKENEIKDNSIEKKVFTEKKEN